MGEAKMTNNLITTSQFVATLIYPVKIKTEQAISKNRTIKQESTDAVIEVTPVVSTPIKGQDMAEQFYSVISASHSQEFSRIKEERLLKFVSSCGEKVKREIRDSLNEEILKKLQNERVDTVIINFIDKDGNLAHSTKNSVDDMLWAISHLKVRLITSQMGKNTPSLAHESTKPRRKERTSKEGGTRRYLSFVNVG